MKNGFNADELFILGIEIEKNGAAFYQAAANVAKTQSAKILFQELHDWELDHVALFEKLRENATAAKPYRLIDDAEGLGQAYLSAMASTHVFTKNTNPVEMAKKCKTVGQALELAIKFEKDSVALYAGMKSFIPKELGARHINTLIREEIKHIGMLQKKL